MGYNVLCHVGLLCSYIGFKTYLGGVYFFQEFHSLELWCTEEYVYREIYIAEIIIS